MNTSALYSAISHLLRYNLVRGLLAVAALLLLAQSESIVFNTYYTFIVLKIALQILMTIWVFKLIAKVWSALWDIFFPRH